MRLFGYYAFHSFVNQVRKIFKTWIIIFIVVCGLVGGIMGYTIASIEEAGDEYHAEQEYLEDEDSEEDPVMDEVLSEDEDMLTEEELYEEFGAAFFGMSFRWVEEGLEVTQNGEIGVYSKGDLLELAVLLVILIILSMEILSADKNGSKIFLMADVNLLFSAPMKPQSVLLFRLMCQIGMQVLLTFYMALQLPNMVLNLGVDMWFGIALLVVWFCLLLTGKMLQVFFYTLCSTREQFKKYLTPGTWAVLIALMGAFAGYGLVSGKNAVGAAVGFFNAPIPRWIPFVGWLKGAVMFSYEKNYILAGVCAALLIVGSVLLIWAVWSMKADFYEDAMAKSEETAALMAAAEDNMGGIAVGGKKKKRSEKLRKNAFHRGFGANVYLMKSLYNRFRFAPLGIFTKTTITYLGVTLACLIFSIVFEEPLAFSFVALAVGTFVFFRAMGNPLEEDTRMPLFVMIPENTWWKLFWSLMSGTVNCLLDILPAFLIGMILTRENPGVVIGWILFILSVDMYATIVAAFINLSVPVSIGKIAKQIIQIMFIYFGLIPDILCIVVGVVMEHLAWAVTGAAAINVALSAIFFALTPLFLEPKAGKRPRVAPVTEEVRRQAAGAFSRLGHSGAWLLIVASVIQIALGRLAGTYYPEFVATEIGMYLITFLPIYAVAFPLAFLLCRKVPAYVPEQRDWKPLGILRLMIMSIMLMYLGNIVGLLVNQVISFILPAPENPLAGYAGAENLFLKIFFLVICAPIMEEMFFRKFLIDRMRVYGEKTAMITTGLMFGLFHGNFSQFFYAAGLGMLFGYVYLRSGKIRYTIGLHMFINFLATYLLDRMNAPNATDTDALIFGAYVLLMLVLMVVGFVLMALRFEYIRFEDVRDELAKGQVFRTVWMNPGMILFFLACLALFLITVLGITF